MRTSRLRGRMSHDKASVDFCDLSVFSALRVGAKLAGTV